MVRVAALGDAPQCRHAVGVHFSVGDRLGLDGGQMELLHDVRIVAKSMSGFETRSLMDA